MDTIQTKYIEHLYTSINNKIQIYIVLPQICYEVFKYVTLTTDNTTYLRKLTYSSAFVSPMSDNGE